MKTKYFVSLNSYPHVIIVIYFRIHYIGNKRNPNENLLVSFLKTQIMFTKTNHVYCIILTKYLQISFLSKCCKGGSCGIQAV